ncbi:hypothetical protein HJFPF1_07113 [Paramyrothecium foliicola]|nr:hypothetical protein HJFPF1_07113 [Paramyrothecium foliicola]
MAHVVAAIGLIGSLLGIWSFAEEQLPKRPEPSDTNGGGEITKYGTTLRVQAGLNNVTNPDKTLWGAGGTFYSAWHYNARDDQIVGHSNFEVIKDGHFYDLEMFSSDGTQAVRTEIWGGYDDICIATMSMTFSDGSHWAWSMSETPVRKISVKWPDFYVDPSQSQLPTEEQAKELCGTSFKAMDEYDNELLSPSGPLRKRGFTHWGKSDDGLVVSSRGGHNATDLCHDTNSYGPDFVSLVEGVYCNMETRETLPLCTGDPTTGECFDVDTASHIMQDGSHKPRIRARNPTEVINWH